MNDGAAEFQKVNSNIWMANKEVVVGDWNKDVRDIESFTKFDPCEGKKVMSENQMNYSIQKNKLTVPNVSKHDFHGDPMSVLLQKGSSNDIKQTDADQKHTASVKDNITMSVLPKDASQMKSLVTDGVKLENKNEESQETSGEVWKERGQAEYRRKSTEVKVSVNL